MGGARGIIRALERGISPETVMSHTFSQLLYHLVFSTKNREALIHPGLRDDLYLYIAGVIRNERGTLLRIGGMPDHVHLLVRLRPAICLSDLLRSVKANSSSWIHGRPDAPPGFAWQEGYGAFTVSESVAGTVFRYIEQQERHHKRRSFKEEWIGLLKKHGIEFDPANPFGAAEPIPREVT